MISLHQRESPNIMSSSYQVPPAIPSLSELDSESGNDEAVVSLVKRSHAIVKSVSLRPRKESMHRRDESPPSIERLEGSLAGGLASPLQPRGSVRFSDSEIAFSTPRSNRSRRPITSFRFRPVSSNSVMPFFPVLQDTKIHGYHY